MLRIATSLIQLDSMEILSLCLKIMELVLSIEVYFSVTLFFESVDRNICFNGCKVYYDLICWTKYSSITWSVGRGKEGKGELKENGDGEWGRVEERKRESGRGIERRRMRAGKRQSGRSEGKWDKESGRAREVGGELELEKERESGKGRVGEGEGRAGEGEGWA